MDALTRGRDLTRVGLLFLVAVAVFGAMFVWLTDRGLGRDSSELYVRFATAERLKRGDPVLFRGVPVGEVKELAFDRGAVVVRARLNRRVPAGADAHAELESVDVFGAQSVVLHTGSAAAPLQDGDTLPGQAPPGLVGRIEELGGRAERLLGDSTINLLHGSLASVSGTGDELQRTLATANGLMLSQSAELTRATAALSATAANLRDATHGDELANTFANLEAVTRNLVGVSERMNRASGSLESVLAKLDRGEGAAGRLVNDPALYDRLLAATVDFDSLMKDVMENPKRYISFSVF